MPYRCEPEPLIDIVDAQVHANQLHPRWLYCDLTSAVDAAVAAMDAVGVRALVHDEVAGVDDALRVLPGSEGPQGAWRATYPFAVRAVEMYPDRFAYVGRIDESDPDLAVLVADAARVPGCRALRVAQVRDQTPLIEQGAYDSYFALAEQHRLPVFISASQRPEVLVPYLRKHPDLIVILDHTGIDYHRFTTPAERSDAVDRVAELATHPNLAIKWCHVERLSNDGYPFDDGLRYLRRVLDAYGLHRVVWGSDCVEARNPERSQHPISWRHSIHYLRDSTMFSPAEKRCMFGASLRALLRWT